MSNVIEVTDDTFEVEVLRAKGPVLVDFFGEYCGPCRLLKPVLAALAEDLGEKVKIVMVDVVANEGLAKTWKIAALPTLAVLAAAVMTSTSLSSGSTKIGP